MAEHNRGLLYESERCEVKGRDPDQVGYLIAQCPCCGEATYFYLSAWDKRRRGKWYTSLAMRPKTDEGGSDREADL